MIVLITLPLFLVVFLSIMLLLDCFQFDAHVGAFLDLIGAMPISLWASRRIFQRYAFALCQKADMNAAARLARKPPQ